jgi:hypothetical protein
MDAFTLHVHIIQLQWLFLIWLLCWFIASTYEAQKLEGKLNKQAFSVCHIPWKQKSLIL